MVLDLLKYTAGAFGAGVLVGGIGIPGLLVAADLLQELDWATDPDRLLRKNHTGYNETPTTEMDNDMNIAKKALTRTRKFVADHKVAVAVTVTAVTTVVVMDKLRGAALDEHLNFLAEKGLTDEYISYLAPSE